MKNKKKRVRRTNGLSKPVAALYEGGNTTVLVKDENTRHHLRPLTQERKDAAYPELDSYGYRKTASILSLDEDDVVRLDDEKGKKMAKSRKNQKRVRRFLALPSAFSNPKAGFAILFAALLTQFSAFIPSSASKIREIFFEDESALNAACVLLRGINGSVQRKGRNYSVNRPVCLRGERDSALSTGFSTSPYAYLGGKVEILGKKHEFWLPLWRCAVAVTSDLPENIRALVDGWPTVIPLLFGCKRVRNSTAMVFGNSIEVSATALQEAGKGCPIISAIFNKFRLSVFERPKRGREIFEAVDGWLEVLHVKGGGTVQPSDEQRFYAAGLCIFGAFLGYLADKEWLSADEAHELFMAARDAVLPQAAAKGISTSEHLAGGWRDRAVFMSFLSGYLKDNSTRIRFGRTPCEAGIVAAIYEREGRELLEVPYKVILSSYTNFLAEFGEPDGWTSEVGFFRAAKKWGIEGFMVGGESGDPWRHSFYKKDVPNNTLNCLGIPVSELSEEVREIIEQSKTVRSGDEEVG